MPNRAQSGCQDGGTPPFLLLARRCAQSSDSFRFAIFSIQNPAGRPPLILSYSYCILIYIVAYHGLSKTLEGVFIRDFLRRCRYIAVAQIQIYGEGKLGIYMQLANGAGIGWDAGNGRSDWSEWYARWIDGWMDGWMDGCRRGRGHRIEAMRTLPYGRGDSVMVLALAPLGLAAPQPSALYRSAPRSIQLSSVQQYSIHTTIQLLLRHSLVPDNYNILKIFSIYINLLYIKIYYILYYRIYSIINLNLFYRVLFLELKIYYYKYYIIS